MLCKLCIHRDTLSGHILQAAAAHRELLAEYQRQFLGHRQRQADVEDVRLQTSINARERERERERERWWQASDSAMAVVYVIPVE